MFSLAARLEMRLMRVRPRPNNRATYCCCRAARQLRGGGKKQIRGIEIRNREQIHPLGAAARAHHPQPHVFLMGKCDGNVMKMCYFFYFGSGKKSILKNVKICSAPIAHAHWHCILQTSFSAQNTFV
jgi:hypothetical protein